jgi:hypothetical protein
MRPEMNEDTRLVIRTFWQAIVVLVVGSGLLFFLDQKLTPSPPQSNDGVNWVWIEAPKAPFLWHRGWWLGCTDDPHNANIRCTLVSGTDHDVIYSGIYLPCGGSSEELPVNAPVPPRHSSNMWVVTEPDHQLAPIVFLKNGSVLVPASIYQQCATFATRQP